MQYMKLDNVQRRELLDALAGMKQFLRETLGSLTAAEAATAGPAGSDCKLKQIHS